MSTGGNEPFVKPYGCVLKFLGNPDFTNEERIVDLKVLLSYSEEEYSRISIEIAKIEAGEFDDELNVPTTLSDDKKYVDVKANAKTMDHPMGPPVSANSSKSSRELIVKYSDKRESEILSEIESEYSDGPEKKRHKADEKYRAWRRTAMLIWNHIVDHRAGNSFLKTSKGKAYTDLIKEPMSLETVKSRIRDGTTKTTAEFHRDVLHVLANAIMFSPEGSEISLMAAEMKDYTDSEMRNLLIYNREEVQA